MQGHANCSAQPSKIQVFRKNLFMSTLGHAPPTWLKEGRTNMIDSNINNICNEESWFLPKR